MDAIRIKDKQLFEDIKVASIREGYKRMEDYIKMLHNNRKIYQHELRNSKK